MDFQDVSPVDGIFEDIRARFEQEEVVILDLAFPVLLSGHGEAAPDLVSEQVVKLASSAVPFFELICVVQCFDEKLLLIFAVQPLPEFLLQVLCQLDYF